MMRSFVLRMAVAGLGLSSFPACRGEVVGEVMHDLPEPVVSPAVAISEVMYHPVLDEGLEEEHEFVELHNPADGARGLGGWKLIIGGREAFTFPEGATIAGSGYLVVAKRKARLAALHTLPAETLVGDFTGALDNGGDRVALVDGEGRPVDSLVYDDASPWPVGADALGAGRAFWPAGVYDGQRFRGRSLERRSFDVPATEARNWEASPLGGGSPGKASQHGGEPPALVTSLGISGPRPGAIKIGDKVTVRATLSAGTPRSMSVEWFVDDVARPDAMESKQLVPLVPAGDGLVAELPAQPARSIVRYRVRADGADEAVLPRDGDPSAFRAYFVEAEAVPAGSYQLFLAPQSWSSLWTGLGPGPNGGCELNAAWNARVPAVLVRDGRVYDVRARYQGSRYNRRNGFPLPAWPAGTGPAQPAALKALSWNLSFPRGDRFVAGKDDKRGTVNLSKQYQACPGVLNALESKLYWAAGVRTQRFRFARLYVNGAYYHYMMEVEGIDEDLMSKTDAPGAPLGDLFKSDGSVDHSGPWGPGNFRPLAANAACPARWSPLDRYRFTYERQTHDWKDATPTGHDDLVAVIEGLRPLYEAAKSSNDWTAVRAHFEKHFDVGQLITHWTIRNFAGVWDDGIHNFFLYRRGSDGKYEAFPQDFDLDFGGDSVTREQDGRLRWNFSRPAEVSIYAGEEGANEPVGGANALKSALIKAFRPEFKARFTELLRGVLSRQSVLGHLDAARGDWDQASWEASPAVGKCDVDARVNAARAWLDARWAYLAGQGLM